MEKRVQGWTCSSKQQIREKAPGCSGHPLQSSLPHSPQLSHCQHHSPLPHSDDKREGNKAAQFALRQWVCLSSSLQQSLRRRMVLRVSLVGIETFEFGISNPGTSTCSGLQGWEAHGTYLFWDYCSLPSQAGLIQILSVFQNISFLVKFEQTL